MDKKHFIDLIDDIFEEYELNWSHREYDVDFESKTGYLVVEAPNNSTRYVDIDLIVSYIVEHRLENTPDNDKLILGNIKRVIAENIEDFSADEEFDELYDPSNPHKTFSPSEFIKILQDDETFFKEMAYKLRHETHGIPKLEELE